MVSKKYNSNQEESAKRSMVSEPASSYGVDINVMKLKAVRSIMDIDNPRQLKEIVDYMQAIKEDWWEAISVEERSMINEGMEDVNSDRIISHKEMKKRYDKWL